MRIKNQKQGDWKGGIWIPTANNPKGTNQHSKKPEVMPKEKTPLQKYMALQDLYERKGKIIEKVRKLQAEFRSISQQMGDYLRK